MSKRSEEDQIDNIFQNLFKSNIINEDTITNDNKENRHIIQDEDNKDNYITGEKNINSSEQISINPQILLFLIKYLKPAQFTLYMYLLCNIYDTEINISSDDLQRDLDLSHVTIGNHIAILKEKGLLEIIKDKNRNQPRTFRLTNITLEDISQETLPNR